MLKILTWMIYPKEVKELKVIMTYANGTIKTSIFTIGKGQIESMLIIITTASNITNKRRKRPTINHNNNIKLTTNNSSSV